MSKVRFFFNQTIRNITTNYPVLFKSRDTEDEFTEGEEESSSRRNGKDGFAAFGIIPYLLKYCEVTNETLTNVMTESVNLVFYIVTFEILKSQEQERILTEIRNKNK